MQIHNFKNLPRENWEKLAARGAVDFSKILPVVREIETEILRDGKKALQKFTAKFDGARFENFQISENEIENAAAKISPKLKTAIETAAKNIEKFHRATAPQNSAKIKTAPGVLCWREIRAIEKVGIYVPGGTAPLFSTAAMLAIPARIAGCREIALATPPNFNGEIHPAILFAARLCGVNKIFRIGGAQAIFALAHGIGEFSKVDKIFGPGNSFVTAAKILVSQKVAIDSPAGPSEVLVIADDDSNAKFVAADLLSQAEHGADSQAVLLCRSESFAKKVLAEIEIQLLKLPRAEIAKKSLQNSFVIFGEDLNVLFEFANFYAAEHLILHLQNWEKFLPKIQNAGSVFGGEFSPESAGDFASGPNHVLPTSGFARAFSGVGVADFCKKISVQTLSKSGLANLAPTISEMARAENLRAHARAAEIRLEDSSQEK